MQKTNKIKTVGWVLGGILLLIIILQSTPKSSQPVQSNGHDNVLTIQADYKARETLAQARITPPLPTLDLSGYETIANSACRMTTTTSPRPRPGSSPVFVAINYPYKEDSWKHFENLPGGNFIELQPGNPSQEITTYVCILEMLVETGRYQGGALAYRRKWTVRVVLWPEGETVSKVDFIGSDAPLQIVQGADAGFGDPPNSETSEWVFMQLSEPSILMHSGAVNAIAFFPDGDSLLTKSQDGFHNWDITTGKEITSGLTTSSDQAIFYPYASAIPVSSGGQRCGTKGTTIRSVDPTVYAVVNQESAVLCTSGSDKPYQTLSGHTYLSFALFSLDGKRFATGSQLGTVEIWDVPSGTLLHHINAHDNGNRIGWVNCMAFSPDGKILATGTNPLDGNLVKLWTVESGDFAGQYSGHSTQVSSLAFSPDGKMLASSSGTIVKLWSINSEP